MGQNRPDELRLTLRRIVILVASFATISGLLVPILRHFGSAGLVNPTLTILLLSPWILGVLIMMLDRRGPVKYWAAPLLLSMTAPALLACQDWLVLRAWAHYGTIPGVLSTLVLNLVLIAAFTLYLGGMTPKHCPRCGRWALIPLLGPGAAVLVGRTEKTRWCGACGSKFWRQHRGEDWKVERRQTWVDALGKATEPRPEEGDAGKAGRHTGSVGPVSRGVYPSTPR